MKLARVIPILALSLALAACGGALAPSAAEPAAVPAPPMMDAQAAPAAGGATALEQGNAAPGAPAQASQQDLQRLVIKTADLSLQVDSARDAEAALRAMVGQLGGYVVKVETS